MTEINVGHPEGKYCITINRGCLSQVSQAFSDKEYSPRCLIISDSQVAELYAKRLMTLLESAGLNPVVLTFDQGEKYKTPDTVTDLCRQAVAAGIDRDSLVFSLGGGIVGDVAGFVAAVCLRGLHLIHLPTTLLAMVDSGVGGKTGVNLPEGKNLMGAFKHPLAVFMDPDV